MKRTHFYSALLAVLAVGLFVRLTHLEADPPNHFKGLGMDLMTDPYHITHFARNQVLFGEWDPYHETRWTAFRVSLMSVFAWLVFLISGVSRYTANLSAVLLHIGAGLLFVIGILRHYGSGVKPDTVGPHGGVALRPAVAAIVTGGLLATSHILLVFGREPFLENGLLFLAALAFFVTVTAKDTLWGAIVVGALAPLCALAGKLFGAVMVAPIFVTLFLCADRRWRQFAVAGASAVITVALWYIFVIGENAAQYHGYLFEQSYGLYGAPPGLSSLKGALAMFLSYGGEARIFRFEFIFPSLLLATALVLVARNRQKGFFGQNAALVFVVVWAIAAWCGLAPFRYRPVRYAMFVIFPLCGVIGLGAGELWARVTGAGETVKRKLKKAQPYFDWASIPIVFAGITVIIANIRYAQLADTLVREQIWEMIQASMWVAAPVTAIIALLNPIIRKLDWRVWRVAFGALLFSSVIVQAYWFQRMYRGFTFDMRNASRDIGTLTSPNAVFTGNFGPNLALDCDRRCVIYSFGLKIDDSNLFRRYPITHIVVDEGNRVKAVEKFSEARQMAQSGQWTFRDVTVMMFRAGAGEDSARYHPTLFEQGIELAGRNMNDRSFLCGKQFYEQHPENLTARKNYIESAIQIGLVDSALVMGRQLIKDTPNDFSSFLLMQRLCAFVAESYNRRELLAEAATCAEEAIRLNPALEADIRRIAARSYRQPVNR